MSTTPRNAGPVAPVPMPGVLSEAVLNYLQIPQFKRKLRSLPPSLMSYGPTSAGKSTEMAIACSRSVWIVTKPTVLRPFEDWCARFPELARELKVHVIDPERPFEQGGMTIIHVPEMQDNGAPLDTLATLQYMMNGFRMLVAKNAFPWSGVFFDEWSVFMNRIWLQCQQPQLFPWAAPFQDKSGKFNPWGDVVQFMVGVVRRISAFANDCCKLIGANAHEMAPKYFDKMDIKRGSKAGDVKTMGGPLHPSPQIATEVVYDFDIVVRLTLEEKETQAAGFGGGFGFGAPAQPAVGNGAQVVAGAPQDPNVAAGLGVALPQMPETKNVAPSAPLVQGAGFTTSSFGAQFGTIAPTGPAAAAPSTPAPSGPTTVSFGFGAPPAEAAPPAIAPGVQVAEKPAGEAPVVSLDEAVKGKDGGQATAAVAKGTLVRKGSYVETVEAVSETGLIRRIQLERTDDYDAKIRAFVSKAKRPFGFRGLLEEAEYDVSIL